MLGLASYSVGAMELQTPQGVAYELQLTNTGEGVVLSGNLRCSAMTQCARCLKPAHVEINAEAEGYYLLKPADEVEGYERDEFDTVDEDGSFDIAPALEAALVYATPYIILCKEDCAGLCPTCGADLNEGPCACDAQDRIDPMNPFAALKDFKFDDEADQSQV